MAIAKVHYSVFKDVELYEVFYNFFSKVSIIRKDPLNKILTLRVEGEGIPNTDSKQVDIEVIEFPGIKPFVIQVNIHDYEFR